MMGHPRDLSKDRRTSEKANQWWRYHEKTDEEIIAEGIALRDSEQASLNHENLDFAIAASRMSLRHSVLLWLIFTNCDWKLGDVEDVRLEVKAWVKVKDKKGKVRKCFRHSTDNSHVRACATTEG